MRATGLVLLLSLAAAAQPPVVNDFVRMRKLKDTIASRIAQYTAEEEYAKKPPEEKMLLAFLKGEKKFGKDDLTGRLVVTTCLVKWEDVQQQQPTEAGKRVLAQLPDVHYERYANHRRPQGPEGCLQDPPRRARQRLPPRPKRGLRVPQEDLPHAERVAVRARHDQEGARGADPGAAADATPAVAMSARPVARASQLVAKVVTPRNSDTVTEISYLDASGREQLRVSRLAMDVIGSQTDFSKEPRLVEARSGRTYFSPVYFRKESEPYITIAMDGRGQDAGVTVVT